MSEELRAITAPEAHELVFAFRGVRVEIAAGCELDFRIRLMQARNQITLALNALPAGEGGQTATAHGQDCPCHERHGNGDGPFDDGGEDDEGPEIGGGMECWDEGDGPAGTFNARED